MDFLSRAALALVTVACPATALGAQEVPAERAYFRAVATFFEVPETEVVILAHGDLPSDEIPVVLFMARRGGVSAEAVVALREAGRTWPELAERFSVGANALHVPVRDPASAGALAPVYERFRLTPVDQWGTIRLEGADIVALVNVRVLSQALGVEPDEIARRSGTGSFVDLYAQLLR